MQLEQKIEQIHNQEIDSVDVIKESLKDLLIGLESGKYRTASFVDKNWKTNTWVKKGILLLFKYGKITDYSQGIFPFSDKDTLPVQNLNFKEKQIRVVPGGTSVRAGCYIGNKVIFMPPAYVNIGAYVDDETMIDSHALVGSGAQVGRKVHVSAGVQIGGVLEPINSIPVIIEDNVLLGGLSGIFEGVIVKKNAVIGAGTVITSSTKVYDLVKNKIYKATKDSPLIIPEGAVVIQGSRKSNFKHEFEEDIFVNTPIIIKYKDDIASGRIEFEDELR